MNTPVETIPLAHGVTIKVYQDTDAQSPADWDNDDAFLWATHDDLTTGESRGTLGELASLPEGFDPEYDTPAYAIFSVRVGYRAQDVYLNSGADVSACFDDACESNVWNGKAFVFIKRASFPAGHDLLATAKSVIEEWNTYLSGDVYGFVVEDAEGEQLHSCWGFYGLDRCIQEAKSEAEAEMPVARGRALLKKAADDVQRGAITAKDIEHWRDRARTVACRVAYPLTVRLDDSADGVAATNRNICDLAAALDAMTKAQRDAIRFDAGNMTGSVPASMVYAAWRERYWPGD